MGLDRQEALKTADKLLQQGKVDRALHDLKRLAREAADDPLTINRIGDLLARHGQFEEAVRHYRGIGAKFAQGGFLAKAVAIYKKIHRLDPEDVEALMSLGTLYLKQKLPGEARGYLLAAADHCLSEKNYDGAREVYERLVVAEPDLPAHRARLAETLALAGRDADAGEQLVELGAKLLERDQVEDAERSFQRAAELLPGRPEPVVGRSRCLARAGDGAQALRVLEDAVEAYGDDPGARGALLGEIALRHEQAGDAEAAIDSLQRAGLGAVPHDALVRIFSWHLERGSVPALWDRMAPVFDAWASDDAAGELVGAMEALCGIEEDEHLPALQWLADLMKARDDAAGTARALERLVVAYRRRQMQDEAADVLERLRKLAPDSKLVADLPRPAAPAAAPAEASAGAAHPDGDGDADAEEASARDAAAAAEAPAVPLDRSDEAFVRGRMTQAEILEKYGLAAQAIEQVREVVDKFPGHVEGQERLVLLLRGEGDPGALADALAGLALAARAAGETGTAQNAADEALQSGRLGPARRAALVAVGLAPAAGGTSAGIPGFEPTGAGTDRPAPSGAPAGGDEALVIDFDADAGDASPSPGSAPASDGPIELSDGEIEEIRFFLQQGMVREAGAALQKLERAGRGGPMFRQLRAEYDAAPSADEGPDVVEVPDEDGDGAVIGIELDAEAETDLEVGAELEADAGTGAEIEVEAAPAEESYAEADEDLSADDDLSELTAALESELFDDAFVERPLPDDGAEQSVSEVFAQFREQVKNEVADDDFQTHYDLGIAYKEMGLMDEAMDEFRLATQSPEMLQDCCIMLAKCHLDRAEAVEAVGWYRKAIDAPGGDEATGAALRYELAEVLLQSGQSGEALSEFRELERLDPTFRDVRSRIEELETHRPG